MDARDAWISQLKRQRLVFRSVATEYWLTTIEDCHNDTRLLWYKVGRLLQLCDVSQSHHTAADLATHFTSKVDNVRQATATAKAPVINQRQSSYVRRVPACDH